MAISVTGRLFRKAASTGISSTKRLALVLRINGIGVPYRV
jgi:hypothetical protein